MYHDSGAFVTKQTIRYSKFMRDHFTVKCAVGYAQDWSPKGRIIINFIHNCIIQCLR